jgi:hypothetical protein
MHCSNEGDKATHDFAASIGSFDITKHSVSIRTFIELLLFLLTENLKSWQ